MSEETKLSKINTAYSSLKFMNLTGRMETTANELIKLETITKDESLLRTQTYHNGEYKVTSIVGAMNSVQPFFHPLIVGKTAYIDCRPFVNQSGDIKNLYEASFLATRAYLDVRWVHDAIEFSQVSELVIDTFATWFSNSLSAKLNIDRRTANYISIMTAIYYKGMFDDDYNLSKDDFDLIMMKKIPMILRIPPNTLTDLLEEFGVDIYEMYKVCAPSKVKATHYNVHLKEGSAVKMNATVTDFVNQIPILSLCAIIEKVIGGNIHIDYTVLQNTLSYGAVIATNGYDLTTIALEHPPTFIAIMSKALGGGPAGKTTVGVAMSIVGRNHNLEALNRIISKVN